MQNTNLGFETDVGNQNFLGAKNPDSALSVEFYMFEEIDAWGSMVESQKVGRKVTIKKKPAPFIRIATPGDNTNIMQLKVREDHKQRFRPQWLNFQIEEGLIEDHIQGWRIEEWDYLKDQLELIRDLKHMRFHTVEQIANASDAQVQGMGMSGNGLRIEAKKSLNDSIAQQLKDVEAKKDEEINNLKADLEGQKEVNSGLQVQIDQINKMMDKKQKKGK